MRWEAPASRWITAKRYQPELTGTNIDDSQPQLGMWQVIGLPSNHGFSYENDPFFVQKLGTLFDTKPISYDDNHNHGWSPPADHDMTTADPPLTTIITTNHNPLPW